MCIGIHTDIRYIKVILYNFTYFSLCRDQLKGCVSDVVILKQTQTDTKGEFNLLREHFKLTGKVEVELESPFDWELRTRLIGGSNPWELSRWGAGAGGGQMQLCVFYAPAGFILLPD